MNRTQYGYLIERIDSDTPEPMSRGHITVGADTTPAALAEELVQRNRGEHSYYSGPRRCSVWVFDPADWLDLRGAPDGAQHYDL
ncbi:hypothetical protein [Streptomyces sp. NPDC093109]|uniref:hypothetical protein n=1 Tax=Streptomyces sp. NPDC093109 TaxID=3154977 RepID=UPI003450D5F3